ncbi:unnamed protein product, partial [Ascophyllum nodosum]
MYAKMVRRRRGVFLQQQRRSVITKIIVITAAAAMVCQNYGEVTTPCSDRYTKRAESPTEERRNVEVVYPPAGKFCREGAVKFCPAGTYGELARLHEEDTCSNLCPAGWYCPTGTVHPFSLACGGPRFYCPEGSGRPLPVDRGFHAIGVKSAPGGQPGGYSAQRRCPIGRFCVDGVSFPCPPGRFGASQLSTNSSCTGVCRKGHFCPEGSYRADQHVCGNVSLYCPEGSSAPAVASAGFYTVQDDVAGVDRHPWLGTVETRTIQVECEPGFYCVAGRRRPCASGTYGAVSGLSSPACSGPCDAGYVCGEGAKSPTEALCGGEGELFCPEGSSAQSKAGVGYYTIGGIATATDFPTADANVRIGKVSDHPLSKATRTAEELCQPGYWCSGGLRHPCEPGSFGDAYGMTGSSCSGACSPGYICGSGSLSPEERPCGDPSVYCPGGNWEPSTVSPGYYSIGGDGATTRIGQAVAPPGRYAKVGTLYMCPPGRYGASYGLSTALCSGGCTRGFYCPAGSVSPMERACGGADLICPPGSDWPIEVDEGHYTTDYSTVPDQEPCAPGYFRNTSFPYNNDPTRGEPSAIVTAIPLPPCQLCPEGTYKAITGDRLDLCLPCDEHTAESIQARTSCICRRISGGMMTAELLYFNTTSTRCQSVTPNFRLPAEAILRESIFTRYEQRECEPGHFCVKGVRFPCPAGRYGASAKANKPECDGPCAAGWFCPEASISATESPCGAAHLYCPSGSAAPIFVDPGFYTIGSYGVANGNGHVGYDGYNLLTKIAVGESVNGNDNRALVNRPDETRGAAFRSDVALCPTGWYCTGDGAGAKCPAGLYGSEQGLNDPACSGMCAGGHFCPSGSSSPFQRKCGGVDVYCPVGSSEPLEVLKGFYGVHAGPQADLLASRDPLNETHGAQVLCEPGYFCDGGRKEPCPPGTFLWQYGESSRNSCTPCKAGYYFPLQANSGPSIVSTPLECGNPGLFCPAGSVEPKTVGVGFYSVGGGLDGTTRVSQ